MEADDGLEFLLDPIDRFPLREKSADNLEHPDPVPMALLPRREVQLPLPADSNYGSGCARRLGDCSPGGSGCEIRHRKNASPTRSPQSTGKVNHEALGWTKVEAGEYTTLEQSIQKYAEEPSKSVVKPELGLSFDLSGEAYDFYNLYSWVVGFGIHYGKSRLKDKRTKIMQEILSGCAGKPEVKNSRSCRCSDKTCLYGMPFGLFVRVNHHFQSVILARVLMRDEQVQSFEWVFAEFLRMMGRQAINKIKRELWKLQFKSASTHRAQMVQNGTSKPRQDGTH